MISISAPVFDVFGEIGIETREGESRPGQSFRRVNRVKTLDAGVSIEDRGYTDGDRTMRYVMDYTQERETTLRRLQSSYGQWILSNREGVFTVAPEDLDVRSDRIEMSLLVREKLSQ